MFKFPENPAARAAVVALLTIPFFYLYLSASPPAFNNNDSPETITACYTLDIMHPPGYPLYAMAGRLFTFIPAGSAAFRVHIMSAFFAMLALAVIFEISAGEPFALILLGLAPVFMAQAADAKGGIYTLNMLFLALVILLCQKMSREFRNKEMYLAAFILGLSLANHWPSTVVIAPAVVLQLFFNRKQITIRALSAAFFLFLTGLTPYIYLPIRAAANPEMNFGNPGTMEGFLWVVLRRGYIQPGTTTKIIFMQLVRFLNVMAGSFSFFLLFAAAGIYHLRKQPRMLAVPALIFLCNFFAVVFFNTSMPENIGLADIFLMPSLLVTALFVSYGISASIKKLKGNTARTLAASACAVMIFSGAVSYEKISCNRNYTAYDYGINILETMEEGALYIPEGDSNLYPLYYLRGVEKKRRDIIIMPVTDIAYKWFRGNMAEKYGRLYPDIFGEPDKNPADYIHAIVLSPEIRDKYRSYYNQKYASLFTFSGSREQKGVLIKFTGRPAVQPYCDFSIYSYRVIFDGPGFKPDGYNYYYDKMVSAWYAASIFNQAMELKRDGNGSAAGMLLAESMRFPQIDAALKSGLAGRY
jgi:hypothetical protein